MSWTLDVTTAMAAIERQHAFRREGCPAHTHAEIYEAHCAADEAIALVVAKPTDPEEARVRRREIKERHEAIKHGLWLLRVGDAGWGYGNGARAMAATAQLMHNLLVAQIPPPIPRAPDRYAYEYATVCQPGYHGGPDRLGTHQPSHLSSTLGKLLEKWNGWKGETVVEVESRGEGYWVTEREVDAVTIRRARMKL